MKLHNWTALVHHYAHDVSPIEGNVTIFPIDRSYINLWVKGRRRFGAPPVIVFSPKRPNPLID
jgi:hypothetical protein